MPKIRIKSFHPQVTVTVRTLWKEHFYDEQCNLLKNNYTTGLMRLISVSGKNADFTAPADMKISDMLRKGIDRDTFFKIILQVVNVLRWIQSQKLSVSNLVLDTENVFVNSKTKELFLLYVPVSGDCQNGSLKSFLEHLVFESSFRLGEDTSFKQELMNLINSGTNLNTKALEHYIVTFCPELKRNFEKYSEHKNANVAASKSEYLRQREALERRDYQEPVCKGKGTDLYYGKSRQIGGATVGTVVLDEDDGTVVLNGQSGTVVLDKSDPDEVSCYPNLIRKSTGEEICIDKMAQRTIFSLRQQFNEQIVCEQYHY